MNGHSLTDHLKDARAKEGLPVRGKSVVTGQGGAVWLGGAPRPADGFGAPASGLWLKGEAPGEVWLDENTLHIADDTPERIEAARLCGLCLVLIGSLALVGFLFLAVYAENLGITARLAALLNGEVV